MKVDLEKHFFGEDLERHMHATHSSIKQQCSCSVTIDTESTTQ